MLVIVSDYIVWMRVLRNREDSKINKGNKG